MENDQLEIIEEAPEVIETPEPKEQTLRETIQEATKETKSRDDKGKFTTKEPKEIQVAVAEKVTKPEAQKPISAPSSWSPAAKEKWASLAPDLQAEITRREEETHKGFTKLDEERNLGKSMKEVINPYMPIIASEGGTPEKAVQSLLNTAYLLRTGSPERKTQLLREIAQTYNIDLGQLSQAPQQQNPQVQGLQQRLDQIERDRAQEINLRKQEDNAKIQAEINAFAADPKNVYYEKVKPLMGSLLGSGQAQTMQEAYDKACRLSDEVYPLLNQPKTEEANRAKEVAKKKAAAASVTGSPGISPNSIPQDRSLRDEIRANLREATS